LTARDSTELVKSVARLVHGSAGSLLDKVWKEMTEGLRAQARERERVEGAFSEKKHCYCRVEMEEELRGWSRGEESSGGCARKESLLLSGFSIGNASLGRGCNHTHCVQASAGDKLTVMRCTRVHRPGSRVCL
jgi:hypothetical protein